MTAKRARRVRHLKRQEVTLRINGRWAPITVPRAFRIMKHMRFSASTLFGPHPSTRGKRGFW